MYTLFQLKKTIIFTIQLMLLVWLSFGISALAVESVDLIEDGANILFDVQQPYASALLKINGPEDGQSFEFGAEELIQIPLPEQDGRYDWELYLLPVLTAAERQTVADHRKQFPGGEIPPPVDISATLLTGYFTVLQDALANLGSLPEETTAQDQDIPGPVLRDQVINDDLIVTSSACIGVDCVNGENFGFDTLRLKENNLRLKFQDTSNSASFPNRDWELVANGTNNGDPEFFAVRDTENSNTIPFRIEADAISNALYVENDGDIGIGTNNPAVELHAVDGDTPTLRLDQDGSVWPLQVWDVAGNEVNFFIRDVNNNLLPLRITPGAPNDSIAVAADGQIAMGVGGGGGAINPLAALHVRSKVNGEVLLRLDDETTAAQLTVDAQGNMVLAGTLGQVSSRQAKENFADVNANTLLARLDSLDVFTWNYKHQDNSERHMGPVAEDFYSAFELGPDNRHIAPSDMAAVALASSKALIDQLQQKDEQIQDLQARVELLETALTRLLQVDSAQASR